VRASHGLGHRRHALGSYQESAEAAMRHAALLMQQGAQMVSSKAAVDRAIVRSSWIAASRSARTGFTPHRCMRSADIGCRGRRAAARVLRCQRRGTRAGGRISWCGIAGRARARFDRALPIPVIGIGRASAAAASSGAADMLGLRR